METEIVELLREIRDNTAPAPAGNAEQLAKSCIEQRVMKWFEEEVADSLNWKDEYEARKSLKKVFK